MRVFMSPTFIDEVCKALKSKDHRDCEDVLIESVYTKKLDEIIQIGSNKRLGGTVNSPFVRKRIDTDGSGKSGGYRLYLWAIQVNDEIYLLFIHPKTGRRSATNIKSEYQRALAKEFVQLRKDGAMIPTKLSKSKTRIILDDKKKTETFIFP